MSTPEERTDTNRKAGDKIYTIPKLAKKLRRIKDEGLKVVLCHGVFDLMHLGHIRHFGEASELGDVLVVTVTPDQYVNKGLHRPVFSQLQRAETIAALGVVDYVAVNDWATAVETIETLKPNVFCKGGEFDKSQALPSGLQAELEAVASVGGRVEFTSENLSSSSSLINDYLEVFPHDTNQWLRDFRNIFEIEQVTGFVERTKDLKVLVIGEAIIDEYVFCDALGKSSKDPILASLYRSTETYAGGSLAVANHLAGFCDKVGLISVIGDMERREEFVFDALFKNVMPSFVTRSGSPTICKRRFVDAYTNNRIFELYTMDDDPLPESCEQAIKEKIVPVLSEYDLVIAVDYGHGMLTGATVDLLCKTAPFLVVSTQANAGNRGFNTISKYSRADYVVMNMHEVALETRMRHADWRDLVLEVTKRIDCGRFTITRGDRGSLHYTTGADFTEAPSMAVNVKDRVGASDAVLALTSLFVFQNAPWEIVGFVGNVAGAQVVAELGNGVRVDKESLMRNVKSLMKRSI